MSVWKWSLGGHTGFSVSGLLTSVWLWLSNPNFSSTLIVYMEKAHWFALMSLSEWPPGGLIAFWCFRTVNFSFVLNVKSKHQQQITYVYGKKPMDFQQYHFENGRLGAILDFSVSGLLTSVWRWTSNSNNVTHYLCIEAYWFWTMFKCNPCIGTATPPGPPFTNMV